MTGVESTLNAKLAELLDNTRYAWNVKAEQRGVLKKGGQIDVLIVEAGYPNVIIECKIGTTEEDVDKRFDNTFKDGTKPSVIFEIKYDEKLRKNTDLLADSKLDYRVHYTKNMKFPRDGFLSDGIKELSIAIQYGRESLNYMVGVEILKDAVISARDIIEELSNTKKTEITNILQQEASPQTFAMAALTLSGAIRFHDMVAEPNNIPVLGSLMFGGVIDVNKLLNAWDDILDINYYPIFSPARKILALFPNTKAPQIIKILNDANSEITTLNLGGSSDLHGQTFQQVIEDRKRLAAFYTKPASAALLAGITIRDNWYDTESVCGIKIADFACGTGSLLQAAYKRVAAYYEAATGKAMCDLHPDMMANNLIGADVLPIAAHLTAAGLSGIYPKQTYQQTQIYQPIQGGKNHKIGSLEWIQNISTLDASEFRLTGGGLHGEKNAPGHNTCDYIIMNPPYVRSVGPGGRVDKTDSRQLFTAFGASDDDRKQMTGRATKLFSNKKSAKTTIPFCANKPAGLATFFMDLVHAKLCRGGGVGLVLPMTAATGVNYRKFRELINTKYTDLVVVSGRFSADTGMKEIMISARKLKNGEKPSKRGLFVNLDKTPESTLEGMCIGGVIRSIKSHKLEDVPPRGGKRLFVGKEEVGTTIDCPTNVAWLAVDTNNNILNQIAYQIGQNKLFIPRAGKHITLKTTLLSKIAKMGSSHLQIRGGESQSEKSTSYSGPFKLVDYNTNCLYPSLWNNDNTTQKQMIVSPDTSLEPLDDSDNVEEIWGTRSHIHMNVDVRTTSQSLMLAYTKDAVVGGTAWPSIIINSRHHKGLAVWCNSTLGILCRWSMSNHQQAGRSRSSRTAILDLSVPMRTSLVKLNSVFNKFKDTKFDRIVNLWKDENRIKMDEMMLEKLKIEVDLDFIRRLLCAEPSMNGGVIPPELT